MIDDLTITLTLKEGTVLQKGKAYDEHIIFLLNKIECLEREVHEYKNDYNCVVVGTPIA